MKVEVLYFEGCPNYPAAVARLRSVLRDEGLPEEVLEIEVNATEAAETTGFLGSPTIRVNGQDIDPTLRASRPVGFSCRTYAGGMPSSEMIRTALREASASTR